MFGRNRKSRSHEVRRAQELSRAVPRREGVERRLMDQDKRVGQSLELAEEPLFAVCWAARSAPWGAADGLEWALDLIMTLRPKLDLTFIIMYIKSCNVH